VARQIVAKICGDESNYFFFAAFEKGAKKNAL
jgi:hypothetical protein